MSNFASDGPRNLGCWRALRVLLHASSFSEPLNLPNEIASQERLNSLAAVVFSVGLSKRLVDRAVAAQCEWRWPSNRLRGLSPRAEICLIRYHGVINPTIVSI